MQIAEFQIINKVIQDNDIGIIIRNNLSEKYFIKFKKEFIFILQHYRKYSNVPDEITFSGKFPDFEYIKTEENEPYLIDKIKEEVVAVRLPKIYQDAADLIQTDAIKSLELMKKSIREIEDEMRIGYGEVSDLTRDSWKRKDNYDESVKRDGLQGISTGIKELDFHTHGMMSEDVISVVGRTNEGKSWILLYFLVSAWKQGKRVLLYSGEMSEIMTGYRFDTINKNIQNSALMHGRSIEKKGTEDVIDYKEYIKDLSESDVPFLIVTPNMLGGQELDTDTLDQLIRTHQPDIVGIDQVSLMKDIKKGENRRIQLANITQDLRTKTEIYKIPFLVAAQANRDAEKSKDKDPSAAPSLIQIADSDDIARNSTRVISIVKLPGTLKLQLIKNTFGLVGQQILMNWDIDYGVIEPMNATIQEDSGESHNFI